MPQKPFSLKPIDPETNNYNLAAFQASFQYYHNPEGARNEAIDPKLQDPAPPVVEEEIPEPPPAPAPVVMQDMPLHDPYAAYSFRYVHPPSINYHQTYEESEGPTYFNHINPSMLSAPGSMPQYTTMAHYSLSPASPTSVISNIPVPTPPEELRHEDFASFSTTGFRIPDTKFDYGAVLQLENVRQAQSHLARDFDLIQYDTEETRVEFLRRCGNPYANLSAQAPIPDQEFCAQLNPGKGGRLTVYEPLYKSYISSKMLEDYFLNGAAIGPRPGNPKCLSKVDIHGQCRYCGEFLVMRNHSYSSHMYSKHGISATTNSVLPLPSRISSTENKRGGIKLQGYCAICTANVDLNERAKENEWISWFYHQQAHNVIERKQ